MHTLEVKVIALTECLVSLGYRLALGGVDAPGIHYNLAGFGRIFIGDNPAIDLQPHTLIIVPPDAPFRVEAPNKGAPTVAASAVTGSHKITITDGVRRHVAGEDVPEIVLICGYFNATYASSIELFRDLAAPIVEQFDTSDQLDRKLVDAMSELVAQEVGMGAMTSALMKQVLIALFRRSIGSTELWVERFSMLSDRQIARAFADMSARPGAEHTVESLAYCAGLSRSAFMARFVAVLGRPPMVALRELRMRQAARELREKNASIDRVAHNAGYASRSSFVKAFRKIHGQDPTEYRSSTGRPDNDGRT